MTSINTLVAESLGEKLKSVGKGAAMAAGAGTLALGADYARRRLRGDTHSDSITGMANKAGEVKDTVKSAFQKKATMADLADADARHKTYAKTFIHGSKNKGGFDTVGFLKKTGSDIKGVAGKGADLLNKGIDKVQKAGNYLNTKDNEITKKIFGLSGKGISDKDEAAFQAARKKALGIGNVIARGKINPEDAKTAEVADSLKRTKPISGSSIYGGNLPKPPKLGPRITNV